MNFKGKKQISRTFLRLVILALILFWYHGEFNTYFKEITLFHQILLYISYLAIIHLALEIMRWKFWSKWFYGEVFYRKRRQQ
ncbi:hypothetical protein [Bacillus sp. B1-b2]|uniref:hypothetical protein n=1 Tax=Bacillus sp. B1-b2 TaxID=2653201 RepID=UPI0012619A30|nr:hypothetical protein [Bacillus sp. B1-b2]KAB7665034.1 hypothetical protein F9279_21815 [Bacillus sp. B1-b2]